MSSSTVDLTKFSFHEASKMTKGFTAPREGEFARKYDGTINGSKRVTVTRLHEEKNLKKGFDAECELQRKYPSRYLVPLIGYCDDDKEMILVHEYMGNKTLADYLSPKGDTLAFNKYLIILIDVAKGMRHIHDEIGVRKLMVHRNIKPDSIHIGDDGHAKLSDFFVKAGTKGYMDLFSRRGDVYSLGIVILQVLCKRTAYDETLPADEQMLGDWAIKCWYEGKFIDIIDADIINELRDFDICLKDLTKLAFSCLTKPNERPKAAALVDQLNSILNKWIHLNGSSTSVAQLQHRPPTSTTRQNQGMNRSSTSDSVAQLQPRPPTSTMRQNQGMNRSSTSDSVAQLQPRPPTSTTEQSRGMNRSSTSDSVAQLQPRPPTSTTGQNLRMNSSSWGMNRSSTSNSVAQLQPRPPTSTTGQNQGMNRSSTSYSVAQLQPRQPTSTTGQNQGMNRSSRGMNRSSTSYSVAQLQPHPPTSTTRLNQWMNRSRWGMNRSSTSYSVDQLQPRQPTSTTGQNQRMNRSSTSYSVAQLQPRQPTSRTGQNQGMNCSSRGMNRSSTSYSVAQLQPHPPTSTTGQNQWMNRSSPWMNRSSPWMNRSSTSVSVAQL